jgi:N utilization substance protein B
MVALQALFAADLGGNPTKTFLDWLLEENPLPERAVDFAHLLIQGVMARQVELDKAIHRFAPAWPVNQLPPVDRNILRLALFELLCCPNTPKKTAINEAVELAKVFGSDSSARFVNGVLGSAMVGLKMGELTPDKTVHEGG